MADTKLSALTALAVEMADTDEIYVNDGGVSKRQAYSVLKAPFFRLDGSVDMTGEFRTDVGTFDSDVANGASADAFVFNTSSTYSANGADLLVIKNNGTEVAAFGAPGNVGVTTAPATYGLKFTNGVDTLKIGAGNQYLSYIVANNALVLATTAGVMISGGSVITGTPTLTDQNGFGMYRNGIFFSRHAAFASSVGYSNRIEIQAHANDDQVCLLAMKGQAACPTATTNIVGGGVTVTGGNGASSSSGNAHGGNVTISGGTGYGTGTKGRIILDLNSIPTSDPSVPGAVYRTAGALMISL